MRAVDRLLVAFLNWRKRNRKAKYLRRFHSEVFHPEARRPDARSWSDAYMKSLRSK